MPAFFQMQMKFFPLSSPLQINPTTFSRAPAPAQTVPSQLLKLSRFLTGFPFSSPFPVTPLPPCSVVVLKLKYEHILLLLFLPRKSQHERRSLCPGDRSVACEPQLVGKPV